MWTLLRHRACRKAYEALETDLFKVRADLADLQDRFVRLQGRLAKRGALSEPEPTPADVEPGPNGERRRALNDAIRAKDRARVRELLAHVPSGNR